jgi:CBS domain-containing protein
MGACLHEWWRIPWPRGKAVRPLRFLKAEPPDVGINDSAIPFVRESTQDALWTISDDCEVGEALVGMSRLGVRAFLVTRAKQLVGLTTFEDIRRARGTYCHATRIAEVMTDACHLPIIAWPALVGATVNDLMQIFERTQVNHLVVVESERGAFMRVRGIIYRRQLIHQLWISPSSRLTNAEVSPVHHEARRRQAVRQRRPPGPRRGSSAVR